MKKYREYFDDYDDEYYQSKKDVIESTQRRRDKKMKNLIRQKNIHELAGYEEDEANSLQPLKKYMRK